MSDAPKCEPMLPDEEGWSEWIHPVPNAGHGYLMQCCDCDLIHEMEFAIVSRDAELNAGRLNEGEGQSVIIFRAKRFQALASPPPQASE